MSVAAGLTAGCGSSTVAPGGTAAKSSTVASSRAAATSSAYCAPLAAFVKAAEANPPSGPAAKEKAKRKIEKLAESVGASASAAGKKDVADFFRLVAHTRADRSHSTTQKKKLFSASAAKATPVILRDCGFDMMKKG